MRHVARYAVSAGRAGLYMPDSTFGPIVAFTRRDLADAIRDEIEFQGFPASTFRQVNLRRLWGFIRRHGSSSAHFTIEHNGREIAFHGLTEAEAGAMAAEAF